MNKETAIFLKQVVDVCRGTMPFVTSKPSSEKTLDDLGAEFLMSAYTFLYEGYTPTETQLDQLKVVASATASTYKELRRKEDEEILLDEQERGLLTFCKAFLYLWQQKVDFSRE